MKAAPFELRRPETVDEAVDELRHHGDEAKVIAGGQSLVPMMNFRMAQPEVLVDLGRVRQLSGVSVDAAGGLHIGAMTRQRDVERDSAVAQGWQLLADSVPQIGHVGIRNRGTIGGSLAHADPAAELPSVCVALDAALLATGPRGTRTIAARDFFEMVFTTVLAPDEVLTEVHIPPVPAHCGFAWLEFARRHGDFALVGVAARVDLGPDGLCAGGRVVLAGAASTPVDVPVTEVVAGRSPDTRLWDEVASVAADAATPMDDIHASGDYRRRLTRVLTRRGMERAHDRVAQGME